MFTFLSFFVGLGLYSLTFWVAAATPAPTSSISEIYSTNGVYIGVYDSITQRNWDEANTYCNNEFGTSLASIHSNNDNNDGYNIFGNNNAWIGFNDITTEGNFEWNDGTPIDYTNWNPGQPNNVANSDCTYYFSSSNWNDGRCTLAYFNRFICNAQILTYSNRGGYIGVYDPLINWSWYDANNYCMNRFGTTLASIHSTKDEDEIFSVLNDKIRWIGYKREYDSSEFLWIDGSDNDFDIRWNPGEPDGYQIGVSFCAVLRDDNDAGDGKCSSSRKYFICNSGTTQAPTTSPTPAPTNNPTPPPTNYPTAAPTEFVCSSKCESLTSELGCSELECVSNCRYCNETIPFYNPNQNNQCQCHNDGCSQCNEGYFKINFDFPCQNCLNSFPGCINCADTIGCQQCENGFDRVLDNNCGIDSVHSDGNPYIYKCVPNLQRRLLNA